MTITKVELEREIASQEGRPPLADVTITVQSYIVLCKLAMKALNYSSKDASEDSSGN